MNDSEEDANDNWLQAYVTGDYFDRVSGGGGGRGAFLTEIRRAFLCPLLQRRELSVLTALRIIELLFVMFLWRNSHLPFFILRLDRAVFRTFLV